MREPLAESLVAADRHVNEEPAAAVHQREDPGGHRDRHRGAGRHEHRGAKAPLQHGVEIASEGGRADPHEQDRDRQPGNDGEHGPPRTCEPGGEVRGGGRLHGVGDAADSPGGEAPDPFGDRVSEPADHVLA